MKWRPLLAPLQGMPKRGTPDTGDCAKMLLDFNDEGFRAALKLYKSHWRKNCLS